MKKVYPVFFTQTKECVLIEVPDLDILTQGKDLVDAIEMARDAIGLKGVAIEDDNEKIPEPSNIETKEPVFIDEGKTIISFVDVDFTAQRRKLDNKAVRRNVTLPNWLNQEADKAHINVSKILQEALMDKLELHR